ncbi:signal peptidase complex subunit 1 isoform X3 [Populus trichocarpa]|nr:signal peptidase complex subunit 1 isoform X3 [Populus trichocarpa]|eukprot:XP_024461841.1 probable signal peptidase complex subunit 1 isoform X2 [Populus trichocarpa]
MSLIPRFPKHLDEDIPSVKKERNYIILLIYKIKSSLVSLFRNFADPILFQTSSPSRFRDLFTSPMDWQGQKLAELWMQVLLIVFAVVAFATGYIMGSFRTMMLIYAGGVVFTSLVTVPNWPFFNRHPLKWLDPSEAEKHPKPQQQVVASKDKKKSSKKLCNFSEKNHEAALSFDFRFC